MRLIFNVGDNRFLVDIRNMTERSIIDIYNFGSITLLEQIRTSINQDGELSFRINGNVVYVKDCVKYSMDDIISSAEVSLTASDLCNAIISDGWYNVRVKICTVENPDGEVCKLVLDKLTLPHEVHKLKFQSLKGSNTYELLLSDIMQLLKHSNSSNPDIIGFELLASVTDPHSKDWNWMEYFDRVKDDRIISD